MANMADKYSVIFRVQLPATVQKRGKWYISGCPALDVMSQGRTKAKAIKNLVEATSLFLTSCFERGTLDAVLKDCGFEAVSKPFKTKPFPQDTIPIDVPIPFFIDSASQRCHV